MVKASDRALGAAMIAGALFALLMCVLWVVAIGDLLTSTRAVSELSAVDPALGRELAAAQRTQSSDADDVAKFARANRDNAEAEKLRAETEQIRRRMEVEKYGWLVVALREYAGCIVALLVLPVLTFLVGRLFPSRPR